MVKSFIFPVLLIASMISCCGIANTAIADSGNNINKPPSVVKRPQIAAAITDRLYTKLVNLNSHKKTRNQRVTIIIESDRLDQSVISLLKSSSAELRYQYNNFHEIKIPAGKFMSLLNRLPDSVFARLPYPNEAVAVTSQGVEITGASDMQALGVHGQGVKLGIIDLGFDGISSAQASGDLPSSLVITDYTGEGVGGSNHGTQVAEVAYDVAPGAEYYLAKISTTTQLQQAVNDMIVAGVRVINHSVAWFGAAFYDGTGPLCSIIDNAQSNGVQWVNAMGNSRNNHYLATFSDSDGNLRHDFYGNQNFNKINLTAGSEVTLIANWDAYPETNIDYNLYLYNGDPSAGGVIVAKSDLRQDGRGKGDTPYESISYTPSVSGTYYIVVEKYNISQSNIRFSLFSIGPGLFTKTTASSIVQPADCYSVLSVAATNLDDSPEWFSSEGPTTDGRAKPDVSAPDRVVTSLSTAFAGTSAASPHVAGAAALLLSQTPTISNLQLRNALINDSHDVHTTDFDYRTGYGRMSMDADLDTFNHDTDNCVLHENIDQSDLDADGLGDVCDSDIDGDGLTNSEETSIGTDIYSKDTDLDGIDDGSEVNQYYTNPLVNDSDSDGLLDGEEVFTYLTDPLFSNRGDLAPRGSADNVLNTADLLILFRLLSGLDTATPYEATVSDVNLDGVFDIRDTLKLRQDLGY